MISNKEIQAINTKAYNIAEFFGCASLHVDEDKKTIGIITDDNTELMTPFENVSHEIIARNLRTLQFRYMLNFIKKGLKEVGVTSIKGGVSNLEATYKNFVIFKFSIGTKTRKPHVWTPKSDFNSNEKILGLLDDAFRNIKDIVNESKPKKKPKEAKKEEVVEYPENSELFNTLKDAIPKNEPKSKEPNPPIEISGTLDEYSLKDKVLPWLEGAPEGMVRDLTRYGKDGQIYFLNYEIFKLIEKMLNIRNTKDYVLLDSNQITLDVEKDLVVADILDIYSLTHKYTSIDVAVDEVASKLNQIYLRQTSLVESELSTQALIQMKRNQRAYDIEVASALSIKKSINELFDEVIVGELDIFEALNALEDNLPEYVSRHMDSLPFTSHKRGIRRG